MSLSVTILFIAIMALIQFPMTVFVGLYRVKTGIRFMDGGDRALMQRMRAHGNFTETVPISLLAIAAAEYSGTPPVLLWTGGASLVLGRLIHFQTVSQIGWGNGRAIGMSLTFVTLVGFALCVLAAQIGLFA